MSFTLSIFDPAIPFEKVKVAKPEIDVWHPQVLITEEIIDQLPHVERDRRAELHVSSGMKIEVPLVTIGIEVGKMVVEDVEALVVNHGPHGIILGKNILHRIFRSGDDNIFLDEHYDEGGATLKHEIDEDSLVVEYYPVQEPYSSKSLEEVLRSQRVLHNIALIASGYMKSDVSKESVNDVLENDTGIHDAYRLKVTSIEEGSVWISLKSGSQKALNYVGSIFEKGASAKLAQEVSEAKKAETDAEISKETRDASIVAIISEKQRLNAENIHKTYETFRSECKAQLAFFDDLINESSNSELKSILKEKKDQAILSLAEQKMVPIVRNVPIQLEIEKDEVISLPHLD